MKHILAATALALSLSLPAAADIEADLDFIITQTVNRTMFESALQAQRPVIVGAVQNQLGNLNLPVADVERFLDILMEEFVEEFTVAMQREARDVYTTLFTIREIADIAAFYRTASGQALIAATPQLMQQGARHGEQAGMQAGRNAMPRVLRRLREEGIVIGDPATTRKLIEKFEL